MKKLIVALFVLSGVSLAQYTTVSGTIKDANNAAYAGGKISAVLTPSGQHFLNTPATPPTPVTQGLDATGAFSMPLADNTKLDGTNSQWTFYVCSAANITFSSPAPVCFNSTITISGSSQSISATLSAAAPLLPTNGGGGSSSFPVTTAVNVNSGGSINPVGAGSAISATQRFIYGSPITPTITGSLTGGSISTGQGVFLEIVYNVGALHTGPSEEFSFVMNAGNNCASGNVCSFAVQAMPAAALTAGYTGYSVYTSSGTGTELLNTACQNVTTCTVTALGAGAAVPTTANIQPAPTGTIATLPAGTGANSTFYEYVMRSDGQFWPDLTVDNNCNNVNPCGFPVHIIPQYYNDTGLKTIGDNALIAVNHQAGNFTSRTNQDRGIWTSMQNNTGDVSSYYGWEANQNQLIFNGNPTITGSPDGEISGFSINVQDNHTGVLNSPNSYAFNGERISMSRTNSGTWGSCGFGCIIGSEIEVRNQVTNTFSSSDMVGSTSKVFDTSGAPTAVFGTAYRARAPGTGRLTGNYGHYAEDFGTNAADWDFVAIGTPAGSGRSTFQGGIFAPKFYQSSSTLALSGSISPNGIATSALATPTLAVNNVSAQGASGATSYSYAIAGLDAYGGSTPCSNTFVFNAGNANLTGGNGNVLSIQIIAADTYPAVSTWAIYRTASAGTPATTGLIGTLTNGTVNVNTAINTTTFTDTGLAGDGTSCPATNTTGTVGPTGIIAGTKNTVQVASDFTGAGTSLTNITGLSWTMPTVAHNYSFTCHIGYNLGTSAQNVAFGIQSATTAPTNIYANGTMGTNATAVSQGPGVLTLATTTATNIVSGTVTNGVELVADFGGTIEWPLLGGSPVINIMALRAANTLTIRRGSYCTLIP